MASRQKAPTDDPRPPNPDEEAVSGAGEGDEIMEEAEDQEDGYSESFSLSPLPRSCYRFIPSSVSHPGRQLTDHGLYFSIIHPYINADMDQLVLLPSWP